VSCVSCVSCRLFVLSRLRHLDMLGTCRPFSLPGEKGPAHTRARNVGA
jgi:hypothetical protein